MVRNILCTDGEEARGWKVRYGILVGENGSRSAMSEIEDPNGGDLTRMVSTSAGPERG